jgi:putative chitobiose transport system permease protein
MQGIPMTRRFSPTPYLFLTPALLVIAVFVLYPMVAVFFYSFTSYDIVTPPKWVGLKNFQDLIVDPIFRLALRNSFVYLIVTPVLIVLSIILAIIVNRKLPGINLFRGLYYIPAISGSIAVGIIWRWVFDAQGGMLNGVLIWLGVLKEPVQWLATPALTIPIAMLLTIWMGMGYYMMIFLAGLQNIPEELYDAALIDGCNSWQKHYYVTLPGLRPQVTMVLVVSSLAAMEVFNEIYVLFGQLGGIMNSGMTMVFYMWYKAFRLQHAGYASAIAIALLVITLVFSIMNIRIFERGTEAA